MSDKNGGLFPKIDKKNLLTVPELVTPPGTVDEEEEASISLSQPNAIEGINCSFFSSKIIDFHPQIQDGEKCKQEDAGKEDQIEDLTSVKEGQVEYLTCVN